MADGSVAIAAKDDNDASFRFALAADDGQNTRDGNLIWAKKDTNDNSWEDLSKFGDLVFIPIDMLAIEPQGRLYTAWGQLRR